MSWWDIVLKNIKKGDILLTPGRGQQGDRQRPFKIISVDNNKIIISSGNSEITLERLCFETIEKAFSRNHRLSLRVASLHANDPIEDSADKLIRDATQSNLSRGNYICSILEKHKLVQYRMQGNKKYIALLLT